MTPSPPGNALWGMSAIGGSARCGQLARRYDRLCERSFFQRPLGERLPKHTTPRRRVAGVATRSAAHGGPTARWPQRRTRSPPQYSCFSAPGRMTKGAGRRRLWNSQVLNSAVSGTSQLTDSSCSGRWSQFCDRRRSGQACAQKMVPQFFRILLPAEPRRSCARDSLINGIVEQR